MASPCSGRAPKWQRRPEARRAEIVEAAITAFGQLGYQRATLADVAKRAGVCPGTVAHYFGSKGALFEAAIADRFGQFVAGEEATMGATEEPAWPRLERLLRHLWDHVWAPGTIELVRVVRVNAAEFPESGQLLRQQLSERWRRLLVTILEDGIRAGEFRRLDAGVAAHAIGHTLVGVADSTAAYAPYDADMPAKEVLWVALMEMVQRYVQQIREAGVTGRRPRKAERQSGRRSGEAA